MTLTGAVGAAEGDAGLRGPQGPGVVAQVGGGVVITGPSRTDLLEALCGVGGEGGKKGGTGGMEPKGSGVTTPNPTANPKSPRIASKIPLETPKSLWKFKMHSGKPKKSHWKPIKSHWKPIKSHWNP